MHRSVGEASGSLFAYAIVLGGWCCQTPFVGAQEIEYLGHKKIPAVQRLLSKPYQVNIGYTESERAQLAEINSAYKAEMLLLQVNDTLGPEDKIPLDATMAQMESNADVILKEIEAVSPRKFLTAMSRLNRQYIEGAMVREAIQDPSLLSSKVLWDALDLNSKQRKNLGEVAGSYRRRLAAHFEEKRREIRDFLRSKQRQCLQVLTPQQAHRYSEIIGEPIDWFAYFEQPFEHSDTSSFLAEQFRPSPFGGAPGGSGVGRPDRSLEEEAKDQVDWVWVTVATFAYQHEIIDVPDSDRDRLLGELRRGNELVSDSPFIRQLRVDWLFQQEAEVPDRVRQILDDDALRTLAHVEMQVRLGPTFESLFLLDHQMIEFLELSMPQQRKIRDSIAKLRDEQRELYRERRDERQAFDAKFVKEMRAQLTVEQNLKYEVFLGL